VLLLLFGRIAIWDSFVSYQRQQPIRSSAGYVMALSVLTIFFPVSERQSIFLYVTNSPPPSNPFTSICALR
jgi:hypothetical protein